MSPRTCFTRSGATGMTSTHDRSATTWKTAPYLAGQRRASMLHDYVGKRVSFGTTTRERGQQTADFGPSPPQWRWNSGRRFLRTTPLLQPESRLPPLRSVRAASQSRSKCVCVGREWQVGVESVVGPSGQKARTTPRPTTTRHRRNGKGQSRERTDQSATLHHASSLTPAMGHVSPRLYTGGNGEDRN